MTTDSGNSLRLCVIPARGGSKRIPRKNIKSFCGKPMLQRSIEAAFGAGCFSHIVVSTDDDEIAELSLQLGALVPFVRPSSLSDDFADTHSVVRHTIDHMARHVVELECPDLPVCCLYATAPFVDSASINSGLELLSSSEFVIPVTSYAYPVERALYCSNDGKLSMVNTENYKKRTQDLTETWHDAGQFYWARTAGWQSSKSPYELVTRALRMPRWRVQDIDTPEDWEHAEALFKALNCE